MIRKELQELLLQCCVPGVWRKSLRAIFILSQPTRKQAGKCARHWRMTQEAHLEPFPVPFGRFLWRTMMPSSMWGRPDINPGTGTTNCCHTLKAFGKDCPRLKQDFSEYSPWDLKSSGEAPSSSSYFSRVDRGDEATSLLEFAVSKLFLCVCHPQANTRVMLELLFWLTTDRVEAIQ